MRELPHDASGFRVEPGPSGYTMVTLIGPGGLPLVAATVAQRVAPRGDGKQLTIDHVRNGRTLTAPVAPAAPPPAPPVPDDAPEAPEVRVWIAAAEWKALGREDRACLGEPVGERWLDWDYDRKTPWITAMVADDEVLVALRGLCDGLAVRLHIGDEPPSDAPVQPKPRPKKKAPKPAPEAPAETAAPEGPYRDRAHDQLDSRMQFMRGRTGLVWIGDRGIETLGRPDGVFVDEWEAMVRQHLPRRYVIARTYFDGGCTWDSRDRRYPGEPEAPEPADTPAADAPADPAVVADPYQTLPEVAAAYALRATDLAASVPPPAAPRNTMFRLAETPTLPEPEDDEHPDGPPYAVLHVSAAVYARYRAALGDCEGGAHHGDWRAKSGAGGASGDRSLVVTRMQLATIEAALGPGARDLLYVEPLDPSAEDDAPAHTLMRGPQVIDVGALAEGMEGGETEATKPAKKGRAKKTADAPTLWRDREPTSTVAWAFPNVAWLSGPDCSVARPSGVTEASWRGIVRARIAEAPEGLWRLYSAKGRCLWDSRDGGAP